MLHNWYKKQQARKEAPQLFRFMLLAPFVGVAAILIARWALSSVDGFLSADQANFMVATLSMIAVPAFVYGGYCAVKIARLARESQLSVVALLSSGED